MSPVENLFFLDKRMFYPSPLLASRKVNPGGIEAKERSLAFFLQGSIDLSRI